MRRIVKVLALVICAGVIAVGTPKMAGAAPEQPAYVVVSEETDFQIREYAPTVVAQFTMRGTYKRAVNDGYIKLERYFLGENTAPERMDLTIPVMVRDDLASGWTVMFVVPSAYRVTSAPQPNDRRIRLLELPARRVASIQFKGKLNETVMREQTERLEDWLRAHDIEHRNDFTLAGYDQGWVPKRFRKNEILVTLK